MTATRSIVLVILLSLAYGSAAAATEGLISSHVPVVAGETTEIAIRELEFLTWWAMPESGIQAVLWPYKVNSPHEKSDGANINPASMTNLQISAVLYPAASCMITIDVSAMTELPTAFTKAHGNHGRAEVILMVIEATRRNLQASQIRQCGLIVKGASSHEELKDTMFPSTISGD